MTLAVGMVGTLGLIYFALFGASPSKAQERRLETVRERHSKSTEVAAQAQLKRILANRTQTRVDSIFQRFIPKPALLRKRLNQTGKNWSLGQYGIASVAIMAIVSILLIARGMPILLAVLIGAFAGIGNPFWVVGL